MALDQNIDVVNNKIFLPVSVISVVDVNRLQRELILFQDYYHKYSLLKNNTKNLKPPITSRMLDNLLELNSFDISVDGTRKLLINFIDNIKVSAPVIHVSFSVDPSIRFLEKIISWFRKEVHPNTLLTIGLQPNIGAGLVVRTTNKYFDFSLKNRLYNSSDYLIKIMKEVK